MTKLRSGKDLKGNLYKIWNRMSSGTCFPPPVRAAEIAKAHGAGTRMLGVPTEPANGPVAQDREVPKSFVTVTHP
jgi:retron-type reverse transcriptase